MYYFIVVLRESEQFFFENDFFLFSAPSFLILFLFFTNHNQCKKDLRKSGGSKGERYTFLLCYGMGKSSCKKATTKT